MAKGRAIEGRIGWNKARHGQGRIGRAYKQGPWAIAHASPTKSICYSHPFFGFLWVYFHMSPSSFFCFVCKYFYYKVIVLRFEGDELRFLKLEFRVLVLD
jgi:hypothetical protein